MTCPGSIAACGWPWPLWLVITGTHCTIPKYQLLSWALKQRIKINEPTNKILDLERLWRQRSISLVTETKNWNQTKAKTEIHSCPGKIWRVNQYVLHYCFSKAWSGNCHLENIYRYSISQWVSKWMTLLFTDKCTPVGRYDDQQVLKRKNIR